MGVDGKKGLQSTFEDSTKQRFSPAQQALDQQLQGSGQFVMLQDTIEVNRRQNNLSGSSFLANPQTATVLAQNGFKNLAADIRHEFQPLADQLARGKMNPMDYSEAKVAMYRAAGVFDRPALSDADLEEGKMIQSMARAGIRVLCAERTAPNLKAHAERVDSFNFMTGQYNKIFESNLHLGDIPKSVIGAIKQTVSDVTGGTVFGDIAQERQRHIDDTRINALEERRNGRYVAGEFKKLQEDMMKGDIALAASIKKEVGKEKTAVYYGSGHGAYGYDLDEALGKDTKKIGLYVSEDRAKATLQAYYAENMQQPHGVIALDTGRSFSAADIDGLVDKNASRLPADLTPGLAKN